jgi:hypothetical protein
MDDSKNQLQEVGENQLPEHSFGLRIIAKIISYVFHPVFVPLYIVTFMLYGHPYLFAGFSEWDKTKVLIQAFVMFTFFPVVTVLLLKALKFINTFQLNTQRDRIIPYVACGIWYFWIWYVWRNLPDYPKEAVMLTMAIFIAASLGLMANIYMKVSMHAMSMGVMTVFFLMVALRQDMHLGIYISIALLVAGIVCTSRLIVSDHTPKEIYLGLGVGAFAMWAASWT